MSDIVQSTFEEWTRGLGPREARISVFNHIRDIPYALIPEIRSSERGPSGVLTWKAGSCTPKHFLLGAMFEKLGIRVIYVTFPFSWNQPNIAYPRELRELVQVLPTEYHLACRAYIDDAWVLVDATWDPSLKDVGFPVNENWDGESDTRVALVYRDVIVHGSAAERDEFVKKQKEKWSKGDELRTAKFIVGLNKWLEEIRVRD